MTSLLLATALIALLLCACSAQQPEVPNAQMGLPAGPVVPQ